MLRCPVVCVCWHSDTLFVFVLCGLDKKIRAPWMWRCNGDCESASGHYSVDNRFHVCHCWLGVSLHFHHGARFEAQILLRDNGNGSLEVRLFLRLFYRSLDGAVRVQLNVHILYTSETTVHVHSNTVSLPPAKTTWIALDMSCNPMLVSSFFRSIENWIAVKINNNV